VVEKQPETIRRMFAEIAPRYDRANRILSMRLDARWRRHLARHLLAAPGRVLDLASGTGELAVELRRVGGHSVVAADFTLEMLLSAREKRERITADALALPFASGSFDAVAVGWGIRNFADALVGLHEIRRVLVPGGAVGVLDLSTPAGWMRPVFNLYFDRVVPLIGGAVTGSASAYQYLHDSVRQFPEGSAFLEMLERAGFSEGKAERLSGGVASFYRAVRR
jgi:demethylmenaquinone methyltransferase/2-methoxy-6-polyprenyl-1,4-benzoquinol methylase